ncbi:hypothetical protein PMAYCL1PPCAC_21835, partial [Pristionchus mayeri]
QAASLMSSDNALCHFPLSMQRISEMGSAISGAMRWAEAAHSIFLQALELSAVSCNGAAGVQPCCGSQAILVTAVQPPAHTA